MVVAVRLHNVPSIEKSIFAVSSKTSIQCNHTVCNHTVCNQHTLRQHFSLRRALFEFFPAKIFVNVTNIQIFIPSALY